MRIQRVSGFFWAPLRGRTPLPYLLTFIDCTRRCDICKQPSPTDKCGGIENFLTSTECYKSCWTDDFSVSVTIWPFTKVTTQEGSCHWNCKFIVD